MFYLVYEENYPEFIPEACLIFREKEEAQAFLDKYASVCKDKNEVEHYTYMALEDPYMSSVEYTFSFHFNRAENKFDESKNSGSSRIVSYNETYFAHEEEGDSFYTLSEINIDAVGDERYIYVNILMPFKSANFKKAHEKAILLLEKERKSGCLENL